MEQVTILGMGMGSAASLTVGGLEALRAARQIVGAKRLLEALPAGCTDNRVAAVKPADIAASLTAFPACVVMSGDTGFYSGTKNLLPLLAGRDVTVLPGITTVQYLAARLGRPWQDVRLVSAHGTACDAVAEVLHGRETFFLTGGAVTPSSIARQLTGAGLGDLLLHVGARLSYPDEVIRSAPAKALTEVSFDGLSAVWAEAVPPAYPVLGGGIDDDAFLRDDRTPMTKREVRAAIAGLLAPQPGSVLWDVGAGTGSVTVELARLHPAVQVWAVERSPEALAVLQANRERFGAWNVRVSPGAAPEALAALPAPDGVFLGGTGGSLSRCLETILEKNPAARVCLSAATAETLAAGVTALCGGPWTDFAVTQITAARSRTAGPYHMMTGMNPIWLLSARGKG